LGATIKGAVLASRKRFVTERFGAPALEKVIATLPESDREILRGIILPAAWYPMETQVRLDTAIVETMGRASERAFWELGRESASDNLPRFQGAIARGRSPMSFLQHTPTIYRLYYGTGRREFVATSEASGTITTYDAEGVTVADCLTIMGWHERALELVGAKQPKISHPICRAKGGSVCRYDVSWK
jgi:uncharacterized protein (TIGR02265 family)